jgi:hypothetical protein
VAANISRLWSWRRAAIVAFTRFFGLVDPYALVRMSVIPVSSRHGRTLLPP